MVARLGRVQSRIGRVGQLARFEHRAGMVSGEAVLDRRSNAASPVAAKLHHHDRMGRLTTTVFDNALSMLHMHANRLLRSAHRLQEAVLYDFLSRDWDRQLARMNAGDYGFRANTVRKLQKHCDIWSITLIICRCRSG